MNHKYLIAAIILAATISTIYLHQNTNNEQNQ